MGKEHQEVFPNIFDTSLSFTLAMEKHDQPELDKSTAGFQPDTEAEKRLVCKFDFRIVGHYIAIPTLDILEVQ